LSSNNSWEQICAEIQQRSLESIQLELKGTSKQYRLEILKCLIAANDDKLLKNKQHEIRKLLKFRDKSKVILKEGYSDIIGGEKNFKRSKNIPHFERHDGCWFDFTIIISPTEIIAFDFEIRFPEGYSPSFLRFDLNLPGHDNQERDIRFHMHPGNDDIMIHSPPMTPIEILHLFLYGLELPKKSRS
jgi:hypothetical protein